MKIKCPHCGNLVDIYISLHATKPDYTQYAVKPIMKEVTK